MLAYSAVADSWRKNNEMFCIKKAFDNSLRCEFIKENKKVKKKKNTLSTKKATKKNRKNANGQEKKKENTLSTKKVRFKKKR